MKTKEELINIVAKALHQPQPSSPEGDDRHTVCRKFAKAALEALCRALPEPKSRDLFDARRKSYDHVKAGNFYNQLKNMREE